MKGCKIKEVKNSKYDIILLHGYKSSKRQQNIIAQHYNNLGYTTIQCDARGHGENKNNGKEEDWTGTIKDLTDVIDSRKNDVIIIGHSMGGTEAISIGLLEPKVKQVFAVSSINGKKIIKDESQLKVLKRYKRKTTLEKDLVLKALPMNFTKFEKENKDKFFLIHDKADNLVPFYEFEENKKQLCLPDENVLIYDSKIKSIIAHVHTMYNPKTIDFIDKKIKTI